MKSHSRLKKPPPPKTKNVRTPCEDAEMPVLMADKAEAGPHR